MGILHMCVTTQRYTNREQGSYPSPVCGACSDHECRSILVSDVHTFHMQGNIQTVSFCLAQHTTLKALLRYLTMGGIV